MRTDIVAGAIFPDYELTDHTGRCGVGGMRVFVHVPLGRQREIRGLVWIRTERDWHEVPSRFAPKGEVSDAGADVLWGLLGALAPTHVEAECDACISLIRLIPAVPFSAV
jgi:hypothetical protein